MNLILAIAYLACGVWLFLLLFWGRFWLADQKINISTNVIQKYPLVRVIIPARNEAELISQGLTSILKQDYLGDFSVVLVDDNSTDSTAAIAKTTAQTLPILQ